MEKGGSQMSSREETQLEFYERLIRTHHKERCVLPLFGCIKEQMMR